MKKPDSTSISNLTTAVFDNGRRGGPRPGCDCEQCFGYCLVDRDQAQRQGFGQGSMSAPVLRDGSLDLDR